MSMKRYAQRYQCNEYYEPHIYEAAEGEWVRAEDALALEARVRELEAETASAERLLSQRAQDLEQYKDRVRELEAENVRIPAERAVLDASALVPSRRLRQFIALEDSSLTDWAKAELARREAK